MPGKPRHNAFVQSSRQHVMPGLNARVGVGVRVYTCAGARGGVVRQSREHCLPVLKALLDCVLRPKGQWAKATNTTIHCCSQCVRCCSSRESAVHHAEVLPCFLSTSVFVTLLSPSTCVCVRVCVRTCVRACVHACMCACVRAPAGGQK